MSHHKRKGPKSTRAGCLLCKPHKRQGTRRVERMKMSDYVRAAKANDQLDAHRLPHRSKETFW